jgi:predicted PurR-regulated permease PerM
VDKTKWLRIGVGLLVLLLAGVFLRLARPVLVPFAMALLISFAVSPALDFLARRKVPKAAALVLILIVSFAVLYLVAMVFYSGGKSLAAELPSYTEMVRGFLERVDALVPDPRFKIGLSDWIQSFNIAQAGTFLLASLGPFFSFMSELLLIFVFMTFILAGRGRLARKLEQAFPPEQASTLSRTALRMDCEIQKYLGVKTLTNVLIGLLVAAVLGLLGVRFALVFGVLALLFNYIPTLGAVAAVALPTLLALFLEGGLSIKVGLVLVLLTGIHLALHRLLERRLMAKEVRLSPLLVLFSLFFWGWLWGLAGMILAVPLLTAARIFFDNVPSLRFLGTIMDN